MSANTSLWRRWMDFCLRRFGVKAEIPETDIWKPRQMKITLDATKEIFLLLFSFGWRDLSIWISCHKIWKLHTHWGLNLSNKPTPTACTRLSNAATWCELRVTRKHQRRHNTGGESWQKKNTADGAMFLKGRPHERKKRRVMITWKCPFTCNTLAARPQRSDCGPREKFLAVGKQWRALCAQRTNCSV